jgi:hypothetical protein
LAASYNAGNGSAGACRQKATSDLLVNAGLKAVLPLGDNQYLCGDYQSYMQVYDLTWGRMKSITHPVPGNHEYLDKGGAGCSTNATGYFKYFGSAAGSSTKGYYSYNIGTWHLVALNSNCSAIGGCGSTSPQGLWLAADLAAHRTSCTLAYWHSPLFSSGTLESLSTRPFWKILYKYGADVILNGHSHIYERFAPQTPDGEPDPVYGIREFIVGTGGEDHTSTTTVAANSQVRNTNTFGVLKLTLHSDSYDWEFVPEAGKTFTDSGTRTCHTPPATVPSVYADAGPAATPVITTTLTP